MAATAITRTFSMPMGCGALVGAGLALAIGGVSIATAAIGGATLAELASELSRHCLGNRRHPWNQRVEQLRPTDRDSDRGEQAPLPKSSSLPLEQGRPDLCPVSCTEARFTASSVDLKRIKANVVHLGQCHWREEIANDPEVLQEIWHSQRAIAEYLLSHPRAEVFVEDPDLLNPADSPNVRRIFPNGLPSDLNSLSPLQREIFIKMGAADILGHLGKISRPHPAISVEKHNKIVDEVEREARRGNTNPYSSELKPLIFDQHHEALMEEIKTYLRTTRDPNRQIIIIYGAEHNFEEYFDTNKYKYIACLSDRGKQLLRDSFEM